MDTTSDRPLVGVSACLLGQPVRYDGRHKYNTWIVEELALSCRLLPLCPETAIGLSVPREPIHLIGNPSHPDAVRVSDGQGNVGQALADYGKTIAAEYPDLCGYIFKARSPSCGISGIPVHNAQGEAIGVGMGLYARALCQAVPELPVVEEGGLTDADKRVHFLSRVHAYYRRAKRRDLTRNTLRVLP